MKPLLFVFLGGGLGSLLRYFLSKAFNDHFQHFFLGTFVANVLGCLVIGFVLGLSVKADYLTQNQVLLLSTGFCGGLTTFSSFAFEKHALLQSGELFHFSIYTISSIIGGVAAVAVGLWLSKLV